MNKQLNLINHLKNFGFVIPTSEIYGGLANTWDYGPLGILMKNNIQNLWWKYFVLRDSRVIGMDGAILMNPNVWKASGHFENFSDLLIECKNCNHRFRVDFLFKKYDLDFFYNNININEIKNEIIFNKKINCPNCEKNDFTDPKFFNLMFQTFLGTTNNSTNTLFLRPETAQSIFVNFKNIQRIMRKKIPFAIAQIGKAFRNEITLENFIFRTFEFEQMEIEWFTNPKDADVIFFEQLKNIENFLIEFIGLSKEKLFLKDVENKDLGHYSKKTIDFEFEYFHGRAELCGLANRTDYDLSKHQEYSKKDLTYFDEKTKTHFLPYVIEPSFGLNRLMYACLCDNYYENNNNNKESKIILKLKPYLAPYILAVLPLTKKQNEVSRKIFKNLISLGFSVNYDDSGSIGRRYWRNDAIGTPYCITCDFDTFDDKKDKIENFDVEKSEFTIRDRDTGKQVKFLYKNLILFLNEELNPFVLNKKNKNIWN